MGFSRFRCAQCRTIGRKEAQTLQLPPQPGLPVHEEEGTGTCFNEPRYPILRAVDGAAAAAEFQKLEELRFVQPTGPIHALVPVGMARAYALSDRREASREQYEEFFVLVEEADDGLPLIEAARVEYASLNS